MTQTTKETADQDIVERLRNDDVVWGVRPSLAFEAANEIELLRKERDGLRSALRTINSFIPKTKEITAFPHWVAIAGDIAEGALNGTWPAYGVMPAPAKEKE